MSMLFICILVFGFVTPDSEKAVNQKSNYIESHKDNVAFLRTSTERTFRAIVDSYDAYIAQNPTDVIPRIELCKFLEVALNDELIDYSRADELLQSRISDIKIMFPENYDAVVYVSSGMEADSAIQYLEDYIIRHKDTMQPESSWALYDQLAESYASIQQPYKALHYGVEAMRYNDTLDITILMAEQCEKVGDPKLALTYLEKFEDKESQCWIYQQKGDAFLRLGKQERAMKQFSRAIQCDTSWWVQLSLGKSLAKLGKYEEARSAFKKAIAGSYSPERGLTLLYLLDLKFGSGDSAFNTYSKLRDVGFHTDPFGRHRAALFLSHPSAPIRFRDIGGLFLLYVSLVLFALLPALWILPVHYASLLRKSPELEVTRWNLRDFWIISSLILLCSFVGLLIFQHENIVEAFGGYSVDDPDVYGLAWYQLTFTGLMLIASFLLTRKSDFMSVWGVRWSKLKSIFVGIGYAFLLRVGGVILILVYAAVFGIEDFSQSPYEYFKPLSNNILQTLLAVKEVFGIPVLILIVVIIAPVSEEIIFRGIALRSIQRHLPFIWANMIQAFLFGLLHGELLQGLFAFLLGLIAGVLRHRSGSLIPGISMHFFNNLLAVIPLLN